MTEPQQKDKQGNYDLENTLETCKNYIQSGENMGDKEKMTQYLMAASALPEAQRKPVYAAIAVGYAQLAEKALQEGYQAPAKIYAAIAAYCMKESGMMPKELLHDEKQSFEQYVSALFKEIPYNNKKTKGDGSEQAQKTPQYGGK